ncbi:hypothetical protein PFISCL1PPCAC_21528, partial [Pristionchus fissidentatus]
MDQIQSQKGSTNFQNGPRSKIRNDDGTSEKETHGHGIDETFDVPGPSSPKRIKVEEVEGEIDGSNHMENLMNFAEDCEKAVKYEDKPAFMDDEVKVEVDEGGD